MEEVEILQKATETLIDKPTEFTIDITPRNTVHRWLQRWGWRPTKRHFFLKGLTLSQYYEISGVILDLKVGNLLPEDVLKLMRQSKKVAEVLAIAVSPSRVGATKELVDFFMHEIEQPEVQVLKDMVFEKMQTISFINTILSFKNLNLMERSPKTGAEIIAAQTPGDSLEVL